MSELRHDPLQKRWTIIATGRSLRPMDSSHQERHRADPPASCPLCPGREAETPSEIQAERKDGKGPDGPGWEIRVIPNLYPALRPGRSSPGEKPGLFHRREGFGAHELVVESPDHSLDFRRMPIERIQRVLRVCQDRMRSLMEDPSITYVQMFKNHGEEAGASMSHPHTQILATPVLPPTVAVELNSAKEHLLRTGSCLFCDLIREEVRLGDRVIRAEEEFIALTPYASRSPYEILILPREHGHAFTDLKPVEAMGLARILRVVLVRLGDLLADPPYNLFLHTSPNPNAQAGKRDSWKTLSRGYHWHIEILPRLTRLGGFEWGTGIFINPTSPEAAARSLRGPGKA